MQMDDDGTQAGSEWRTGGETFWRRCTDVLATAGAYAVMAVDAGDKRAQRRQIDMVVGVDIGLSGGIERMIAMRAGGQHRLDHLVGVLGKCAGDTGTVTAPYARPIRKVRLLPLRRR